jgi:hypothetical protein
MRGATAPFWALLFGLSACGWAPFDPSLMEDPPSDERDRDRDRFDDRADDATDEGEDGDPTDDPSSDDPVEDDPREDDPSEDDPQDEQDPGPDDPVTLEPTGENEPNDSMNDAQPVGVADVVYAEWTPAGDEDWYVLALYEGDVIDIRTHADDGGCDFDSIIVFYGEWDQPATSVETCDDESPELLCVDDVEEVSCASVTVQIPQDGEYYVRVLEWGSDDHALYSIEFELVQ